MKRVTVRRLVLAFLVIPFSDIVSAFSYSFFSNRIRSTSALSFTNQRAAAPTWGSWDEALPFILILGFSALYWTAVWAGVVRWSGRLVAFTALALVGATLGALAFVLVREHFRPQPSIYLSRLNLLPPQVASGFYVIATALIWLEPRHRILAWSAQSGPPPRCPSCGYDMSALKQSRCPECGADHTLGSLIAAQTESELA